MSGKTRRVVVQLWNDTELDKSIDVGFRSGNSGRGKTRDLAPGEVDTVMVDVSAVDPTKGSLVLNWGNGGREYYLTSITESEPEELEVDPLGFAVRFWLDESEGNLPCE